MSRRAQLGFDRKLELSWLDLTAAKATEGKSADVIREELLGELRSLAHQGAKHGSARAKTVRVLLRVWGGVEPELEDLHNRALNLVTAVEPNQRLGLHWAMLMAVYPFFTDHAEIAGRLLRLQDTVSVPQIRRRIAEQWGDRSTVFRTSRHVVRSMVDWGVLEDAGKGKYRRGHVVVELPVPVTELLVEALLHDAEKESLSPDQLQQHGALFPFKYDVSTHALRQSPKLEVHRQGVDREVVTLVR